MDNIEKLFNLLGTKDGFIPTDKRLARKIGLEESAFLCELISQQVYWSNRGELINGYFFSTVKNMQEQTGLTRKKQERIVKKLKELELIREYNGKLNTRHFSVCINNVLALLENSVSPKGAYNNNNTSPNCTNSMESSPQTYQLESTNCTNSKSQTYQLESPKGAHNNNNQEQKNKNNYNNNKDIEEDNIIHLEEVINSSRKAKEGTSFSPTDINNIDKVGNNEISFSSHNSLDELNNKRKTLNFLIKTSISKNNLEDKEKYTILLGELRQIIEAKEKQEIKANITSL